MDDMNMHSSRYNENESWGFQEPVDSLDAFEKKKMDFGLPEYESIKQLQITEKQLVVLTETGRIYRQLYEERVQLQEVELPSSSQPIFGFFGSKYSYEPIEKFYLDKSGTHCLLQGKSEQVYYWHVSETKIKKTLPKLCRDITAIAFDELTTSDVEIEFLFATKGKEFHYGKISRKKQGESDFNSQLLNGILPVKNSPLMSIFIYRLDFMKSVYTCILVCDDQSFNYLYEEGNLQSVLKKYSEKSNKVNVEDYPIHQPGDMKISLAKRIGDHRPHSLAYTTGETLILLKFGLRNVLPDDSFLKNSDYLQFGKYKEDGNNANATQSNSNQRFTTTEKVEKIALSEFNYFLLYPECLTIMSRRSQQVVECFELGNMQGQIIDMIFDDSSSQRSLLIYSRKRVIKIAINNEEQRACEDFLSAKDTESAFRIASRNKLDLLGYISGLYGDKLFSQGQYVSAANRYAQSQLSFEEVMLKFVRESALDSVDGLIEYVKLIKSQLGKDQEVQRKILLGISLEQFNFKLNELERQLEVAQWEEEANSEQNMAQRQYLDDLNSKFQMVKKDKGGYELICLKDSVEERLRKQSAEEEDGGSYSSAQTATSNTTITQKKKKHQSILSSLKQTSAFPSFSSKQVEEKLRRLRNGYKELLKSDSAKNEQPMVYEVMQSHGRIADCLNFAKEMDNYENVITHYVNEQSYLEAVSFIKALASRDSKRALEMVYKFAYILLNALPKEFLGFLLSNVKQFQPTRLISGIMNIPQSHAFHGITFLHHCVYRLKNSDKIIHNLYLFFLANYITSKTSIQGDTGVLNSADNNNNYNPLENTNKIDGNQPQKPSQRGSNSNGSNSKNQIVFIHRDSVSLKGDKMYEKLMEYLKQTEDLVNQLSGDARHEEDENEEGNSSLYNNSSSERSSSNSHSRLAVGSNKAIQFDLDFALRLFEQKGLTDAAVKIYALMNFYELAVKLALDRNHIELAKEYASKDISLDRRGKLWLRIAMHLIDTQQSQSVLDLTKESNSILKIEDLLPHFKEVHQVDQLKEQICKSLQDYNNEIEDLKKEVDTLNTMSDALKKENNAYYFKFLQIQGQHDCSMCKKDLVAEDHYIFTCLHGFHRNCLFNAVEDAQNGRNNRNNSNNYTNEDTVSTSYQNTNAVQNNNSNNINAVSADNQGGLQLSRKDSSRGQRQAENATRAFKKVAAFNQFLNGAQQDLKFRQEEALKQIRQQLIQEKTANSINAASTLTRFFKGLAFGGGQSKGKDEDNGIYDPEILQKRIAALTSKDAVQTFFNQEEREEYLKKLNFVDDYLAKECFYCGISAVDRMHSVYVRKDQDWGL